MSKIEDKNIYPLPEVVTDDDTLIGTSRDGVNKTRQFSAVGLSEYIKEKLGGEYLEVPVEMVLQYASQVDLPAMKKGETRIIRIDSVSMWGNGYDGGFAVMGGLSGGLRVVNKSLLICLSDSPGGDFSEVGDNYYLIDGLHPPTVMPVLVLPNVALANYNSMYLLPDNSLWYLNQAGDGYESAGSVVKGQLLSPVTFKNSFGFIVSPVGGKLYYDTASDVYYKWNGSQYVSLAFSGLSHIVDTATGVKATYNLEFTDADNIVYLVDPKNCIYRRGNTLYYKDNNEVEYNLLSGGGGGSIDQNNLVPVVRIFQESMGASIAATVNSRYILNVGEKDNLLIYFGAIERKPLTSKLIIGTPPTAVNLQSVYLFTAGKGTWGSGATAVSDTDFVLIYKREVSEFPLGANPAIYEIAYSDLDEPATAVNTDPNGPYTIGVGDDVFFVIRKADNSEYKLYRWVGSDGSWGVGANSAVNGDFLLVETEIPTVQNQELHTRIEYLDLVALRDGSALEVGRRYEITDFVTTVDKTDCRSAGHPFNVIVTATAPDKLSEEALAVARSGDLYFSGTNFEAWKLWYCLDNDKRRFDWADTSKGRGVIYRMIDEFGNDLPYDFKNVQFDASGWKFTFNDGAGGDSSLSGESNHNILEPQALSGETKTDGNELIANVFNISVCNKLQRMCQNNLALDVLTDNEIIEFTNNIVNDKFMLNNIVSANNCTFNGDFSNNNIKSAYNITFGDFLSNTVEIFITKTTIGDNALRNYIEEMDYCLIGENFSFNHVRGLRHSEIGDNLMKACIGKNVGYIKYLNPLSLVPIVIDDDVIGNVGHLIDLDAAILLLSVPPKALHLKKTSVAGTFVLESVINESQVESVIITI